MLRDLVPRAWLAGSYLWDAVLGDLHRRGGNSEISRRHLERALASAPTDAVRALLRRRFALGTGQEAALPGAAGLAAVPGPSRSRLQRVVR